MAKNKRSQQRQAPRPDDPSVWRDRNGRNRKDEKGEYVTPTEDLRQMIEDAKASPKAATDQTGTAKHIADIEAAIAARG